MCKSWGKKIKEWDRSKREIWAKKSKKYKITYWIIFFIWISFIVNMISFVTDKFKLSFGIGMLIAMGMGAILGLILKIGDIIYTKRTKRNL